MRELGLAAGAKAAVDVVVVNGLADEDDIGDAEVESKGYDGWEEATPYCAWRRDAG